MKLRRLLTSGLLALALCAFCASQAVRAAQEKQPQGEQKAEQAPEDTSAGQIFRWLNFILVFGGLGFLIAKSAPAYFRARADEVSREITEAAAKKAEADARLREAEAGLAQLDQAQAKMRADAQRDFAAEAERIKKAAAADVEKVEHMAGVEIDATIRMSMIELRAAAARHAVERAAAMVAEQMTPGRRELIFRKFVANLPRGAN
jgi:F0F1-type ATP synthase membrane subunit b/b'